MMNAAPGSGAMNYFCDLLEGLPGIRAIRVDESTGANMAGWYSPPGTYYPEKLESLSVKRFAEAVRAELGRIYAGAYRKQTASGRRR